MRNFLMALTVLAGTAVATGANAAPTGNAAQPALHATAVDGAALVQPVQYYPDWRYREWRRREAYERFRRREWRREHGFYGRPYGYGYGYGRY